MSQFTVLARTTAIATLLATGAAYADVTAEQVWQSLVDYNSTMGQTVASEQREMDGDTLVLSGVTFTTEMPEGKTEMSIAEIRLKELGDGRVEVTMSPDFPMTFNMTPPEGEAVDMNIGFRQSGLTVVVAGETGNMTYDLAADELAMAMDGMTVDGKPIAFQADVVLQNNVITYRMVDGPTTVISSTSNSESISIDVSGEDPEGGGKFTMTGKVASLGGTSTLTLPEGVDMADMNAAIKAGFDMSVALTYGPGSYAFELDDEANSAQGSASGSGGALDIAMGANGLAMGFTGGASESSISGASIPFPVSISMAETAMQFAMPLLKSDTPMPFKFVMKLVDLKVSDEIWAMFDPTSQLPRDPATMVIDVSGQAKLLVDLTDPEQAAATEVPGEIHALDVNALRLAVAGAELSGSGGFTFDNTDVSMGYPKPLGALELSLTGANAMMDKLVAMGLLPEDQVMGARMMMGMFAVPSGADALTSKIEFRDDGGLYANGQRLQ